MTRATMSSGGETVATAIPRMIESAVENNSEVQCTVNGVILVARPTDTVSHVMARYRAAISRHERERTESSKIGLMIDALQVANASCGSIHKAVATTVGDDFAVAVKVTCDATPTEQEISAALIARGMFAVGMTAQLGGSSRTQVVASRRGDTRPVLIVFTVQSWTAARRRS